MYIAPAKSRFRFREEIKVKITVVPDEISIEDFARMIGVTPRTVRNYITEGVVTSGGRGKIKLAASVQGVIAAARVARPDSVLDRARARALDARTRAQELRSAREEKTLIEMDEAMALVEDVTGLFVAAIESVPARYTRDMKMRLALEQVVFDVRTDVADRMSKRAAELRNGEPK